MNLKGEVFEGVYLVVRFILRRVLLSIPILLVVTIITFWLIHSVPGDVSDMLINPRTKPEERERIRHNLGLDKPLPVQYAMWLKGLVLKGNLGYSLVDGVPVRKKIFERMPATLLLMGGAYVLSFMIALPLGVHSAVRRGTWCDHLLTFFSFAGLSVPSFWLSLMAIYLFTQKLGLFPSVGGVFWKEEGLFHKIPVVAWYMFLPCMVLAFRNIAVWSRYLRSSMIEVLQEDYIRTAKALGIAEDTILYKYALKPALLPLITLVGLTLPDVASGSFVVEFLFGWPGIGRLGIEAINLRDYPLIMGDILIASVIIILANLISDLMYGWVDPRIRVR